MNTVYRATSFAVCLTLLACGNKGDLYLDKIELSAEQKALLESGGAVTDPEKDLEKDPETDLKKPKKKKPDAAQTTE